MAPKLTTSIIRATLRLSKTPDFISSSMSHCSMSFCADNQLTSDTNPRTTTYRLVGPVNTMNFHVLQTPVNFGLNALDANIDTPFAFTDNFCCQSMSERVRQSHAGIRPRNVRPQKWRNDTEKKPSCSDIDGKIQAHIEILRIATWAVSTRASKRIGLSLTDRTTNKDTIARPSDDFSHGRQCWNT